MSRLRQVSIDVLREGSTLTSPLYDDEGAKLLAAGVQLTPQLLQRLRARGVSNVVVSHDDLCQNDNVPELESTASVENEGPFWDQVKTHGVSVYKSWLVAPTKKAYQSRIKEVAKFHTSLGHRRIIDADEIRAVAINIMLMAAEDIDYFTSLASEHCTDPTKSCTNVAMLAIALGINLGLGCEALIDLGSGCMLKDAGPMEGDKWSEVSPRTKLCATQIDEFCDGSGSPKRLKADEIHLLAKIACVAKRFYQFIGRKNATPHDAVVAVLTDMKNKRYHPAVVRALLDTTSLYPIGSSVTLDDERTALVIRAQRGKHATPVVCIGDATSESSTVIDLATAEVAIAESLELV